MNQKMNDYCSRVERTFDVRLGRHLRCPICKEEGTPVKDNHLVMEHRVKTDGVEYHRWSYATGRKVELQSESTNVL